jgi:tetratricopeptide (TPR) repeat protein
VDSPSALFEELSERRKHGFRLAYADDVRSAAERFPSDARLLMLRASVEQFCGNLDAAAETAEKALMLGYSDPTCIAIAANLSGILGDFTESAALFECAAELDPNNFELLRNYAGVLLMMGSSESGRDWAWKCVEFSPANPLLLSSAANIASLLNDSELYSAARSALEDQFPEHEAAWLLKARAVLREDADQALSEEYALRAAAANPDAYNCWEHLAMVRCAQGKWLEAKQACEVAIGLCARSPSALNTMTKILRHEGDEAAAKEYEQRARDAVPALAAMQEVAKVTKLVRSGKHSEAAKLLERMLESPIAPVRNASERAALTFGPINSFSQLVDKTLSRLESEGRFSADYYIAKSVRLKAAGQADAAEAVLKQGMKKFPNQSAIRAQATVFEIEKAGSDEQIDAIVDGVVQKPFGSATLYPPLVEALLKKKRPDCAERITTLLERKFSHSSAAYLCRGMLHLEKGEAAAGMRDVMRGLRYSGHPVRARSRSCLTAVLLLPAFLIVLFERLFGIKRRR